ncbi:hypothetical protein GC167_07515 [bacterium]|nr:hypothetical protein [bacterium]
MEPRPHFAAMAKRSRNWLYLKGGLWVLLGILALIFSQSVTLTLVRIFGLFALLSAASGFASWFSMRKEPESRSLLFQALLDLGIGLILLLYPKATDILGIAMGIWLVLHSFSEIEAGWKLRRWSPDGNSRLIFGVFLLALGVFIAINPSLVLQSLTWIAALGLIALGSAMVFIATRLGKALRHQSE